MRKLSIAIPTYNRPDYLKECLQSIACQTFQNFEIFVFDNASNPPIEEEIKKIDKKIHFIGNEKNVGSLGNIQRILKYPFKSEYLIIFHDDDFMHPKMLETQVNLLDSDPKIVFVDTNFNYATDNNISHFGNIGNPEFIISDNNYDFVRSILSYAHFCFSSVMYRMDTLRSFRSSDFNFERFSIIFDKPLLVEISKMGKTGFINSKLVNYRMHPQKDSFTGPLIKEARVVDIINFYKQNLPQPLSGRDFKLFYCFSTNSLLDSYTRFKGGFRDFVRFIKEHRQLIYFRYLNRYGIMALFKIALKGFRS